MKGRSRFNIEHNTNAISKYFADPMDTYVVMANFKAIFVRVGTKSDELSKFFLLKYRKSKLV